MSQEGTLAPPPDPSRLAGGCATNFSHEGNYRTPPEVPRDGGSQWLHERKVAARIFTSNRFEQHYAGVTEETGLDPRRVEPWNRIVAPGGIQTEVSSNASTTSLFV